ncbi:MAG: hypothetical protein Ct9H300mP28_11450 [Pseudomonadota bacterium]|nr:MAG: hypothetical protein Ct9H300mP28_11450 [Pseudomonadota bacterium]
MGYIGGGILFLLNVIMYLKPDFFGSLMEQQQFAFHL